MRFKLIDGLRGVAALAVVFYHLAIPTVAAAAGAWAPRPLELIIAQGYLGVDIFFVLSGFVIAYSTRQGPHTFGYLGRFALRRSIRLDPAYWATIVLEIAVVALTLRLFSSFDPDLPTMAQVVAHLFYIQNITGQGDLLPIFWTLAYEIQFYVGFVLLLIAWGSSRRVQRIAPIALGTLFLVSMLFRFGPPDSHGFAIDRWFQFFLGVLSYWTVSRKVGPAPIVVAMALVSSAAVLRDMPEQLVALATAGLIVWAGLREHMGAILAGATFQYLGKISYSLYLTHLIFGHRFIALANSMLPPLNAVTTWLLYTAGIAVSVIAADVWWRAIERPTMAFSKRVALHAAPAPKQVQVAASSAA